MKKIFMLTLMVALVMIGPVAFAADVYNDGNDTLVADRIVKAIPNFDSSKPVYACYNGNGWCGANPALGTSEMLKGTQMVQKGEYWVAKGMAGERFHPSQLAVTKPEDVKDVTKDILWAKLERVTPVRSTSWVDWSEGSPCILVKK